MADHTGQTLFVARILATGIPVAEEDRLPHRDYLDGLAAAGTLLLSGPVQSDEAGLAGLFVMRAEDHIAARRLLDDEPFHRAGVYTSTILTWTPVKGALLPQLDPAS